MNGFLLVVHVVVAVFLILVVLLQAGKGASIGATFGGSSQTVFGSRGPASFLGKLTTAAAAVFMITSMVLAVGTNNSKAASVIEETTAPIETPAKPTDNAPVDEGGFDPFKKAEDTLNKKQEGTKE